MGRAEHSADRSPRRCTLLSFQRPLRLRDGSRRSQRLGPQGGPKRAQKYSTAEAACLGGGPQAAEASLPHLQHMPVKTIDLEVEGLCGQRLAVELDPSLLDQAPPLAAAETKGAGDQPRQVDQPVAVGAVLAEVDLRHLLRRRV